MNVDLQGSLNYASLIASHSQANNTGSTGYDLTNYKGKVVVTVNVGVKTIGDANGTIVVYPMTSATNNVSNAVNYGTAVINTTNNTSAFGTLAIDTRNASRYLFLGVTVGGTNSPAYPLSASLVGQQEVQPVQ